MDRPNGFGRPPEPSDSSPPEPTPHEPVTHNPRGVTRHKLFLLRQENNEFPWEDYPRPKTRGDCVDGGINAQRPCPFASCQWHLAVNVNPSGSFSETFEGADFTEMPHTCALDVADEGGSTLEYIGHILNVTREAIRLVESKALTKLAFTRNPTLLEHAHMDVDSQSMDELDSEDDD